MSSSGLAFRALATGLRSCGAIRRRRMRDRKRIVRVFLDRGDGRGAAPSSLTFTRSFCRLLPIATKVPGKSRWSYGAIVRGQTPASHVLLDAPPPARSSRPPPASPAELDKPHCIGCAHGRFRNLKSNAPNTRTIPTFTISLSQNRFLKNRTSTPITTVTSAST